MDLQREARFDEADAKNVELAQLKDDEFVIAQKDLSSKQEGEDREFNHFARRLIDEFERRWDAEILQAQAEDEAEIESLKKRQAQEYANHRQAHETTPPIKFRNSAEYLRLRRVQEYMSQQKSY